MCSWSRRSISVAHWCVFNSLWTKKWSPVAPRKRIHHNTLQEGAAHYWFWVFSCRISPDLYWKLQYRSDINSFICIFSYFNSTFKELIIIIQRQEGTIATIKDNEMEKKKRPKLVGAAHMTTISTDARRFCFDLDSQEGAPRRADGGRQLLPLRLAPASVNAWKKTHVKPNTSETTETCLLNLCTRQK